MKPQVLEEITWVGLIYHGLTAGWVSGAHHTCTISHHGIRNHVASGNTESNASYGGSMTPPELHNGKANQTHTALLQRGRLEGMALT